MLRLGVLGRFEMTADGQPVAFEARSAAYALARVALARGRPVARERVASTLWPDADEVTARTNLRKALQRVRKATPSAEVLVAEGDALRLNVEAVETDLDLADRLHRTFLLAARQPEGMAALVEEWKLRRRTLLEGWEGDWIEDHRAQATLFGNDLGTELALSHEAMGDPEAALNVWHEILERIPHHAQALQNAMRLELQLRGRERAAELARTARLLFHQDLGIEMPLELRRTVRELRSGGMEPVPPPDFLRKRSELHLLARLFESNLADNRTEALALLARECSLPKALAHPRSMLSLLTLALDQTSGTSPERLQVAALAATIASWSSEFEVGHRWSDFVLQALGPREPMYGSVLSMKGFMLFEQRDYKAAERALDQAVEVLDAQGRCDDAMRARIGRAAVHWHLEAYEAAIRLYEACIAHSDGRQDEIALLIRASSNSNLCFVYMTMGQWQRAIAHGRTSLSFTEAHPVFGWIVPSPLGIALFFVGQRREGLRMLARGLSSTLREGMTRFNQISLDYAAVVLAQAGRERVARCLLHANSVHRAALRHIRSPAERGLIVRTTGIDPEAPPGQDNPLAGQSAATLSEWACEEMDRLAQREDERDEPVELPGL